MIVSNTQLLPEFQYYFSKFVETSIVNRYEIPIPVEVDQQFIQGGTVIELLFKEEFPYDNYTYLYKNEERVYMWPTLTKQRLMIYPGSKYLIPTTDQNTGYNVFNLQVDDFFMLDAMLLYRKNPYVVSMVDSTSVDIITVNGITYVYASVNALSTPLSKEIYLYLQIKIHGNYEFYNTTETISDNSLLAACFELKLIDEYFSFFQNRVTHLGISCTSGTSGTSGPVPDDSIVLPRQAFIHQIPEGIHIFDVLFIPALTNTDYIVVGNVLNETDLTPALFSHTITNRSETKFTVELSGKTDSPNYIFCYIVDQLYNY